jgi:hypothetical protein
MINVVPPFNVVLYYYVRSMEKRLIDNFDMPEFLKCTAGQEKNILSIAHEKEVLVSVAYEQEILFRITNGKEVFTKILDGQGVEKCYLIERSCHYS